MKLILEVNKEKKKYIFNAHRVITFVDGTIQEDSRCIEDDDLDEFLRKLKNFLNNPNNK